MALAVMLSQEISIILVYRFLNHETSYSLPTVYSADVLNVCKIKTFDQALKWAIALQVHIGFPHFSIKIRVCILVF